jgi:flotillin
MGWVLVGFVLLLLAALFGLWATRYAKVGPNEVLIVAGRPRPVTDPETGQTRTLGYRVVKGGGTFVRPVRERTYRLSLELVTVDVVARDAHSSQGVRVSLDAVAQVKVGGADTLIERAAEQFLGRSREDIVGVALEVLEGYVRAVAGTLTVEELYLQRELVAQRVREAARGDFASMGLEIVALVIRGITDEQGYLEAMGRPRLAQVKRDAVIGEAEAEREAEHARAQAEMRVEEYRRDLELAKAAYETEVRTRRAEVDLAYDLARHRREKEVREAELEVEIAAKEKQVRLEEAEVRRRQQTLEAEVKRQAEAEHYRILQLAEAERLRRAAEGEGVAAEIRSRGLAEADAARAVGAAEADAMAAKAAAWARYNEAAVAEMLIGVLPELAEKVAAPLGRIEKIVVINSGGDASAGASRVTADVAAILGQLPAIVESLTGVKLERLLERVPGLRDGQDSEN